MNRRAFSFAVLVFTVLAPGLAQQRLFTPPESAREALKLVTSSSLMGHIRFLSDDLLEGRAPATHGDKLAQAYIAAQMEACGLQPGTRDSRKRCSLSPASEPSAA